MNAMLFERCVRAVVTIAVLLALAACAGQSGTQLNERQIKARAIWQEHCKHSGEFIQKTVSNVDGIFLMNIREEINLDDQHKLNDPYGLDSIKDAYIENFLRDFYHQRKEPFAAGAPPRIGFNFVEATDPNGKRYRYTGHMEEPWQVDKSYLRGYFRFSTTKTPAPAAGPRYGVSFADISTQEDRKYWIAGSSLKIIDLETKEVIAERVGYMFDPAQGNRSGGRAPWLWAANNACPSFPRNSNTGAIAPAFSAQPGQTLDFVEKVLLPSK